MTCPAWRLVAEPRKGWNFFNLVKVSWKGVDVQSCLTQDPTVKNWGIGWANKVSFFSMDSLSFSHQCSCLWLFVLNSHEIMRVLSISKDFPLPMIPEDQTDLWRSQLPLPRTPAPRCSSHLKDFIQNMPWFWPQKKVVAIRLETVRVSHVTRFEPKLRRKNEYFSNKLATETSAWPCEKEKHAGFKRESRKSCSTESGSCAGCLFLAPKRICLKACWWVQR